MEIGIAFPKVMPAGASGRIVEWAERELILVIRDRRPEVQAGVPLQKQEGCRSRFDSQVIVLKGLGSIHIRRHAARMAASFTTTPSFPIPPVVSSPPWHKRPRWMSRSSSR